MPLTVRQRWRWRIGPVALSIVLIFLAAAGGQPRPGRPVDPVIGAAGDIACGLRADGEPRNTSAEVCHQGRTAGLLVAGHYDAVLPLGDTQYNCGGAAGFQRSYDPTWGRLKAISRPVIGNHEYGSYCQTDDPSAYFDYFGANAGPPKGWYSYDLGAWHLIALNSECSSGTGKYAVGGCGAGSAQVRWLRKDLASHRNLCTLAYWHEARFSSALHGGSQSMAYVWNIVVQAGVDVVLSGHDHVYERFAPLGTTSRMNGPAALAQQPTPDPRGTRLFVVGTGGLDHHAWQTGPLRGEQARNNTTFGILRLVLHPGSYDWQFVGEPGASFTDVGSSACH